MGEVVDFLAKHGADVNKADKHGRPPLCIAAQYDRMEVVKVLAEHGADLNKATTRDGFTAAYIAASFGHTEVVKVLAQRGADLNKVDKSDVSNSANLDKIDKNRSIILAILAKH